MNNLETAVPFMKQLYELLDSKTSELNRNLSDLNINRINFENVLTRINEQIISAEKNYTIAFVGTFKTGKSTIINSLLNLQGNARLSSEYDPDTAKCIRLMHKTKEQQYDTEVVFTDTYATERLSWDEAKKYTSQVALDSIDNTEIIKKAEKIDEVRYYIDHPFLDRCNILDLPGTGTGLHSDHTDVTDRKIMESDCIFWVVSTDGEPDSESILNLEKFSTKMLPIINVWQSESEDIYSPILAEDIKDMLFSQFGAYFASAEDPIFYYAREIDLAQQENRPLKAEWGKMAFTDKVEEILSNIQKGDRMVRIKKQISIALQTCEDSLKDLKENPTLISIANIEKNEGHEITKSLNKLDNASIVANSDIKNHAKKSAQEIIDIFSDASDAFIENQMQGTNFNALLRKKKFKEDLKNDFENNYVRINSGWLESNAKEYSDDVLMILRGIYSDFALEISDTSENNTFSMKENDLSGFIDDMVKIMAQDMGARIAPAVIAAIAGTIMMFIPGGLIFEALGTMVVSGLSATVGIAKDDKLRSKITGIKNASKVQIKQQRSTIVNSLYALYKKAQRKITYFRDKICLEIQKDQSRILNLQRAIMDKQKRYEITFSHATVGLNDTLDRLERMTKNLDIDEVLCLVDNDSMSIKERYLENPSEIEREVQKAVYNKFESMIDCSSDSVDQKTICMAAGICFYNHLSLCCGQRSHHMRA